MAWRNESNPEICKLLALVHRQAVRGFVPGLYGGMTLDAPIRNGRGTTKAKCSLVIDEIADLTSAPKSGTN